MQKFIRISLAALVLVSSALAAAADFGGTWVAKYQDRRGRTQQMIFKLAVVKNNVSGTAYILNAELPIQSGKVEGDKVHFEVRYEYDADIGHDILLFDGKLVGNTLEIVRTTKGRQGSQKLVATKNTAKS